MSPKKSLLEQCKSVQPKRMADSSNLDVETAIAWFRNEIVLQQLNTAIGCTNTTTYCFLARSLRLAYQQGRIAIVP